MYRNIRRLCNQWSIITYGNHLDYIIDYSDYDKELGDLVKELFDELDISDCFMTGNTVTRLNRDEKVELKGTINGVGFTDIYHECINDYNFSPALYLIKFIDVLRKSNIPSNEYVGWLHRSMRAFPSLLRETDYAMQLSEALGKSDAFVLIESNAEQDIKKHIDILLTYQGKQYYIWSYIDTPKAIEKLRGRLICEEKHRIIPDGVHLLAPIHISDKNRVDNIGEWLFAKQTEVEQLCYLISDVSCQKRGCADYNAVKQWLKNTTESAELIEALGEISAIIK